MRFVTWILVCTIAPFGALYAAPPIPVEKPISGIKSNSETGPTLTNKAKPATKPEHNAFESVIENAMNIISGESVEIPIIMPPPLPKQKQKQNKKISLDDHTMVSSLPVPTIKPFKVFTRQSQNLGDQLKNNQRSNDNNVVIRYQSNNEERMAGRHVPSQRNSERVYAKKIGRLRETTNKSPFKTAKLPKAGNQSMSDPIILFFKESSPEMEVGQMTILRDDVLTPLNGSTSRTATINGYASPDRSDEDQARRLSLSRALMIREFLIDNRIAPERIDVRAMADDTSISPKDRVDISLSQ